MSKEIMEDKINNVHKKKQPMNCLQESIVMLKYSSSYWDFLDKMELNISKTDE